MAGVTNASSLLLLLLSCLLQVGEKWATYSPKGAGFAVELPPGDHPQSDTPFVGPGGLAGTLHQVLVGTDDLYCDVRRYQCRRPIAKADQGRWLDWVRDQQAGPGAHGKVDGDEEYKLGAVVGREFTLRTEGPGGFAARGRAFIKGPTVYLILASSRKGGQELPPDADRFLDSFALGARPAGKAPAGKPAAGKAGGKAGPGVKWATLDLTAINYGKESASVLMPGEPRGTLGGGLPEPLHGYTLFTHVAESPATDYVVSVYSCKDKAPPGDAKAREVAREWALNGLGTPGKVTSDEPVPAGPAECREFAMTITRGPQVKAATLGRTIVTGKAIFVLAVVGKGKVRGNGKDLSPEADHFFGSFKLEAPAPVSPP